MRNAYEIVIRKPETKRPLVRAWSKWEYITKMNLKQVVMIWAGFICLRIGYRGGCLCIR
jgi:hypothetical protein